MDGVAPRVSNEANIPMKTSSLFKPLSCKILPLAIALFLPLAASSSIRADGKLKIENGLYTVEFDSTRGDFSIQHKPSGKTFAKDGKFDGTAGSATELSVSDKIFGNGRAIEVRYANGNRNTVALYDSLPFVLFSGQLHNGGSAPVVLNKVKPFSVAVALDKNSRELKTLGTGGLLPPAQNPGSYAFLTVADPATRNGVVGGWITHDRGSGVVFSPVEGDNVRMQAQIDYGRLRIKPGADASTETFALGYFDDARFGLEFYADAIAKVYAITLHPQTPGFCTWYMDKNGRACDEKHLAELSEYAAKNLKPFGFDFVQIDDGWQMGESKNGPNKNFTAHRPNGAYPSGMKATADTISKLGLTPGIWFMPFAGTYYDSFFKDHQDWFVKNEKGEPYETAWGGTCLDMTQAGAREHLRRTVSRIAHEWGYKLFKMDGFWTGSATKQVYVNDGYREDGIGDAEFSNPDKTNIEALRDGVKLVREAAGPDVFLLGCCVSQNMRSFGGSFGLLDAMRVGPDTSGRIGSTQGSRLWFLNGRVWYNDPDCVYVRTSTPLNEARLNASWATISGQLFYDSDWIPDLPPERLDILKRCMPAHNLPSRPVDIFENQPAQIWLLTDTRGEMRRDVLALYHWGKKQESVSCVLDKTGLPPAKEYVAFDFWANKFVPPFHDQIRSDFSAEGCRILSILPVSKNPLLLSTSRHVTQGMVDVTGLKWDAGSRTLSGTSKVVGNDPYELRIVVPVGPKSWQTQSVNVSSDDKTAGVKTSFTQDGPRVRATLQSAISRDVKWTISFEPASVTAEAPKPVTNLKANAEYRNVSLVWDDTGADSYRVTRDDGITFECSNPSFTDISIAHGQAYKYSVASIAWNGSPGEAASLEVSTPAELKPPATVRPDIYLGDLKPVSVKTGGGTVGYDKNASGKPLSVAGKKYAKGLGLHANALAVYTIPTGTSRFVSVVGIDDDELRNTHSSVVFEVYGDVREMGEPPLLVGQSPVLSSKTIRNWAFNIELNSRFKELRLMVTDAGDGNNGDHADWVDAGFKNGK